MEGDPSPTSWVDRRVVVGESSIEGRGLFVSSAVDVGEALVRFGGSVVADRELRALLDRAAAHGTYVDTIALGTNRHLVLDDSIARFGNHSCDPTLALDGSLTLIARRPLQRGDELTVDDGTFSTLPEWSMRCRCGAAICRGAVTGTD